MPSRGVRIDAVPTPVAEGISRLRDRLEVPREFPPAALQEAERLRMEPPQFPQHVDRTDMEFVTVDPASSKDLDQAVHIARRGSGYVVHYAIADVASWVTPDSALAGEAWRRGETLYAPGARVPLHPAAVAEEAGSLLADGRARPAVLWTHELDADGNSIGVGVERALVRSRAKLSYEGAQAGIEAGDSHPSIALLPEVGRLRQQLEAERGGVSLNLPDQEIVAARGTWHTQFRDWLPVEDYNAQISLLTGMAAAQIMLQAGVGLLRTLPTAPQNAIQRLRWSARTLGVDWSVSQPYPEFVRSLDAANPRELAVLARCTALFRGAGYVAFEGQVPDEDLGHAALAAPYAHVTAPLRRLADRYAAEVCLAAHLGHPLPEWVSKALPALPEVMAASNRRAKAWERGVVDLAEALVLASRVGEIFDAILIDVNPKTGIGTFQIGDPAVEAQLPADGWQAGQAVRVRLDRVDLEDGKVIFSQSG